MTKIIDARGKKCPLPIILTKQCISQSTIGDKISVLLDNEISKNNLIQYLHELNIGCTEESLPNQQYSLIFKLCDEPSSDNSDNSENILCPITIDKSKIGKYIMVIKSNEMGQGVTKLGERLMRSYINTITSLESYPKTIIFYNSGVELLDKSNDTIESLKELESVGVEILACGICVEYYETDIEVGEISNMFKIGNIISNAEKIIYP